MEGNSHADSFKSSSTTPNSTDPGVAETVRNSASAVADKAQGALSSAKSKASDIPAMLADKLEAGAQALRQDRAPTMATANGVSTGAAVSDSPINQASDKLSSGMQASADWLRDADFGKLRDGLEQQVKERPGRTLLIALGVGYLLGKTIRR